VTAKNKFGLGSPSVGAVGYMDMFESPRTMAAPQFLNSDNGRTIILNWEIVRGFNVVDYELY
jgi:hypothetical protein